MNWTITSIGWLFALMCTLGTPQCLAQANPVIFQKFSNAQGLPNNLFRTTLEDKHGVLWMAGGDGLASYDGHKFTSFRHNNADTTSISGNNIMVIYEDSKERLWVSSFNGLDVSDVSKTKFRRVTISNTDSTGAPMQVVKHITEDSLGNIWMVSDTSIWVMQERDGQFVRVELPDLLQKDSLCPELKEPTLLFTDRKGRVWIGTSDGLCIYKYTTERLYCPEEILGLPRGSVHDVSYDREGRLWVAAGQAETRLFYSNPDHLAFKPFDGIRFLSPASVSIAFDFDNRLWACAFTDQVYGYDFRDSTLFLESRVNSNAVMEQFIRNPFVDHSGNVWLHVEGYLIYRYPKGIKNYLHPYPFHQSCTAIYGTGDTLWIAYREEGLVQLNKKTNAHQLYSTMSGKEPRISANLIAEMIKLRSGNYILVGFNKVDVMRPDGTLVRSHLVSGSNRSGYQDSKGRIWIGGFSGLVEFSEEEGKIATHKLALRVNDSRNFIQSILEDRQGRIWFASGIHGLGMLIPETGELKQFYPVPGDFHSLPSGSLIDMAIDEQDIIWIATDVALARMNARTFEITSYDKSHGLTNDYINAVVCGDDGNIWIATNGGIAAFNPTTERFTNYIFEDGLLNRNYLAGSKFQSPEGTIYFGGENGVDYFDPKQLRKNPAGPVMYLSAVTVNNQRSYTANDVSEAGTLRLTHKDDQIEIEFVGLYYSAQQLIQNAYRMDGIHNDWIDLGTQRTVVFSDLKPGEYVFHARSASSDGIWTAQELTIPIVISPPYYETWWFRVLAFFVVAGLLFAYIKYREIRVQRKERQEAEVARKITELERRALQAQMNPHFIYNCMNSIQQFMIMRDFEGAMKYLTRFSRLLRMVLNMSAQHRIALSDEIKLIEDYLELESMRFPNKFTYSIRVSPEIDINSMEIPPFFIQPQVENAIRHGLINKTSTGKLIIKIDKIDEQMLIVVEDDGVGRKASHALKNQDRAIHESKGLSIVKERLAHLQPKNGHEPFSVTDLYDIQGGAAGTRVEIRLPIE